MYDERGGEVVHCTTKQLMMNEFASKLVLHKKLINPLTDENEENHDFNDFINTYMYGKLTYVKDDLIDSVQWV